MANLILILYLTLHTVVLSQLKGLDEFKEIPLPLTHDTLVEYEKVYAVSPYIGAQYFYSMPTTPENTGVIFEFTKNILEINGGDIEQPTYNHNPREEAWYIDDGFEKMAKESINYYNMVRREWFLDIEEQVWYVQFESYNGHVFFRAGQK